MSGRSRPLLFLVLAGLLTACGHSSHEPGEHEPGAHEPGAHSIEYEVDLARARTCGWAPVEGDDAAALGVLAHELERRLLERMEIEASVAPTEEGGLVLTLPEPLSEEDAKSADRLLLLTGMVEFGIVAEHGDALDLREETARMERWKEEHPAAPVAGFRFVAAEDGGSPASLRWYPRRPREGVPAKPVPLLPPSSRAEWFDAFDFGQVYATWDTLGYPALGFDVVEPRRAELEAFTRAHTNQPLAMVLDGEVVSAPTIDEPLPGHGVIRGDFDEAKVAELVRALGPDTTGGFLRHAAAPPR